MLRPARGRISSVFVGLLTVLLCGSGTSAQPVRIHVEADTVRVGERFTFSLAVGHRPGEEVLFPDLPRTRVPETEPLLTVGDVEILDAERLPPVVKGNLRTDSIVFHGVAFVLDTARVGPVPVRLLADGDTTIIQSGEVALPVAGHAAADDEPAGLLEPIPFPDPRPLWIALGLFGVILLALAGWGLRRLYRAGKPLDPSEPPITEARRRLRALATREYIEEEQRNATIELSDTLRTYIERRLGIPALERTTYETDRALADDHRISDALRTDIRNILTQCDLVKFAEMTLPADSWFPLLQEAREVIEKLEASLVEQENRKQAEGTLEMKMERASQAPES